ncbi:MAG: hypothetical protein ACRDTM_01415 [Micromonosporaceae bacterium]
MRTPRYLALAGIGIVAVLGATLPQLTAGAAEEKSTYIVRLADPPLAAYQGGTAGIPATSPAVAKGIRLNVDSPASKAYLKHLASRQAGAQVAITSAIGRSVKPDVHLPPRVQRNGSDPDEVRSRQRAAAAWCDIGAAAVHPQDHH